MQNEGIRFLAFALGALLLFHGIDKMIYGTEHIEKIILDMYVPNVEKRVPFGSWFSPFMPGTVFMGKMFVGKEFVSSLEQIRLISYSVYLPELIAPIFLIFGKFIRVMAFLVASYMLLLIFLAYRISSNVLMDLGGWNIEVLVLYLTASMILIFYKISDCNLNHNQFSHKPKTKSKARRKVKKR